MNTQQLIDSMNTHIAEMVCPNCESPIELTREDPRGGDAVLPYCCGFFWIPVWQMADGRLHVSLSGWYSGSPRALVAPHDNEIQMQTEDGRFPSPSIEHIEHGGPELPAPPPESYEGSSESSEGSSEEDSDNLPEENLQPRVKDNLPIWQDPDVSNDKRIEEYLINVADNHEAMTGEIRTATRLGKSSFKYAMDKLRQVGTVEAVEAVHGLYRLIT